MTTTRIYLGTRPVTWPGSTADEKANRDSHATMYADPDEGGRCAYCDSREGSTSAGWPCGFEVPRESYYRTEEVPFVSWTDRINCAVAEIDRALDGEGATR